MADTYKCPGCGSALIFDAREQEMKCSSCENVYPVKDIEQYYSIDQQMNSATGMEWQTPTPGTWSEGDAAHLHAYRCQSCGSEVVVEDTTAASFCVYCGNPLVMADAYTGEYKPEVVIPFKKTLEEAKTAYKDYCAKKKLLPRGFMTEGQIEKITGVYVPFWLFNCNTDSNLSYKCTKVRSHRSGNYEITDTYHYKVIRGGTLAFDDVPADGAKSMDDKMMESIEPFDTKQQQPFTLPYLSGYQAQRHDVPAEECKERANKRIRQSVINRFAQTVVGYHSVVPDMTSIRIEHGQVREALMPVWLLNTRWKDKVYTFAMNGQTGHFIGNLPVSVGRAVSWFAGIALGVTAIAAAVCYFLVKGGVI